MELPINKILTGCSLKVLKTLPEKSVHCIVTSPPYWGLRDYKVEPTKWPRVVFTIWGKKFVIPKMECCLGLEPTPEAYVGHLILIFREAKRVLRDDGTFWCNIGDSYAAAPKKRSEEQAARKSTLKGSKESQIACKDQIKKTVSGLKPKDLVGIPWMLSFALRDSGWYLRQDIIWHKPNPMPESVTDRCTKSHEYIFLFSKSQTYYFDAGSIKTIAKNPEDDLRRINAQTWDNKNTPDELRNGIRPRKSGNKERKSGTDRGCPENTGSNVCGNVPWEGSLANKKTVWTINTMPFKEAHYAVYPEKLIVDCIKAGCPEGGIVLDMFFGAGTTGLVAEKLNRKWIGIEVGPHNVKLADNRIRKEIGLFL